MTLLVAQCVDPNAGLTGKADKFAMCTVGLDLSARRYYLLDMLGDIRPDTTDQPKIVTEEYHEWDAICAANGWQFLFVGIQTIFYESDLFRHLKREKVVPLKEIPRRRGTGTGSLSKYLICLGLQGRWERGQIVLPGEGGLESEGGKGDFEDCPWLQPFIDELMDIKFMEGKEQHKFDDMVEAVALCVEMLSIFLRAESAPTEPRYSKWSYGQAPPEKKRPGGLS